MSVNAKITEQIRHSQVQTQEITLFKESFVIVPYQVSGIADYTNRGYVNQQVRPQDYETFKRIWTGNDAAVIQWKGSIEFVDKPEPQINYKLGEIILGVMETNDNEVRVEQDASLSDYIAQDIKQTYTFRVDRQLIDGNIIFDITDYHLLCLYKIPEISNSTLFRISNLEKDYVGRKLQGYVLTLESINQEFANTGSARLQNIMPSAPGQGYLECKVEDSTWPQRIGETFNDLTEGKDYLKLYDRYVIADYEKIKNRPVKKVVVKQLGVGVLSSVCLVGRPVQEGESFNLYKAPRQIFPINFTNASTPNLFHTQQETSNYYFGEFQPTIKYWADWKEKMTNLFNYGSAKWEFEGFVRFVYDDLTKTNPLVDGTFKWELYGMLEKSTSEVKRIPWEFEAPTKIINTSNIIGCDVEYTIGGTKKIHDHMFDNYWTQKNMKSLPIDTNSSVSMGWLSEGVNTLINTSITNLVLNFLIWAIGTSTKWIGRIIPLKYQSFRGIMNANIIDLQKEQWELAGDQNAMPLDLLKTNGDSDSPASLFFNGNTVNTSFEADLTDRMMIAGYSTPVSTLNIGQTKDENGNWLLAGHRQLLLNGSSHLIDADTTGYIIDEIQINGIFNGEYSVEFLDKDGNVVWSSIFQSAGKWSNSLRDTWTIRNTSVYNRENVWFNDQLPYPEKLDEPLLELPDLDNVVSPLVQIAESVYVNDKTSKSYFSWGNANAANKAPDEMVWRPNKKISGIDTVAWPAVPYKWLSSNYSKIFEFNNVITDSSKFFTYYSKVSIKLIAKSVSYLGFRRGTLNSEINFNYESQTTQREELIIDIPDVGNTVRVEIPTSQLKNPQSGKINTYYEPLKSFDLSFTFDDTGIFANVSKFEYYTRDEMNNMVDSTSIVVGPTLQIDWFPLVNLPLINSGSSAVLGFNPSGYLDARWYLEFVLIPRI